MARLHTLCTVAVLLSLSACDSDPVDISGTYSVAITNGPNGCNLANYTVGETATNITMVVTQNDTAASAEVQGVAGLALSALVGGNTFVGTVDGSDVTLRIAGNRMMTMGTCDYHFDATADARLTGDALAGNVAYTPVTDGATDCGPLEGCETIQMFSGSRPPR